jgi:hypothetical protein
LAAGVRFDVGLVRGVFLFEPEFMCDFDLDLLFLEAVWALGGEIAVHA